eukprot:271007-Heterocapsa_arctica.AAC.1
MDAPDREAPIEDRPNPHAGVRIGEASVPGPPPVAGTHRIEAARHDRKPQRSAGKTMKEVAGWSEQFSVALSRV